MSTKNYTLETNKRSLGFDFKSISCYSGIYDETKEFQLRILKNRRLLMQFVGELCFTEFDYQITKSSIWGPNIKKQNPEMYPIVRGIVCKILKEQFEFSYRESGEKFATKSNTIRGYNVQYLNDILDVDKKVIEKYNNIIFKLKYYDLI